MKQKKIQTAEKQKLFVTILFLFITSIAFGQCQAVGGNCNCSYLDKNTITWSPSYATCADCAAAANASGNSGGCQCFGACTTPTTTPTTTTNPTPATNNNTTTTKKTYPFQVSPGQVTFPAASQGMPSFTEDGSSAVEDWAAEFRLRQFGIKNENERMLISTGDLPFDKEYYKQADSWNPAISSGTPVLMGGSPDFWYPDMRSASNGEINENSLPEVPELARELGVFLVGELPGEAAYAGIFIIDINSNQNDPIEALKQASDDMLTKAVTESAINTYEQHTISKSIANDLLQNRPTDVNNIITIIQNTTRFEKFSKWAELFGIMTKASNAQ